MSLEDRFDIESPLHVGQVATAYPARQRSLDRKVLLKVLHRHWIEDEELVERFIREGRAVARIDHPNVVRVYECGKEEEIPYLALEWIEGGTLADEIARGPMREEEVRRIALAILKGLSAVHAQGLLHRDLKPDNILIGRDGRIVLADFSLAGFEALPGVTQHGAIVGSPAYMAPELAEGKPASARSDLFGVGVILLEALTGFNPYAADDPLVSLDRIRKIEPPRLTGKKRFTPGLAELIDTLLERDPQARPVNPDAAIAILEGEPLTRKETTGKRLTLAWAALGVALIVVFAMLFRSDRASRIEGRSGADENVASEQTGDTLDVQAESTVISTDVDTLVPVIEPAIRYEPAPVETSVARKPARLTVIARPWAEVTVDGRDAGVTPLGTILLPAGEHDVVFRHDLYPEVRRRLILKSGLRDTVEVDFTAENARVSLSAVPWGCLWVDGDSIGLLPRKSPLWLAPGEHLIEIKHPEFKTWRTPIEVEPGGRRSLRVDMKSGTMIATDINSVKH